MERRCGQSKYSNDLSDCGQLVINTSPQSTDIAKLEDLKGQLIYKESEVIQLQGKIQETLVEKSKDEEAFQTRLNKITVMPVKLVSFFPLPQNIFYF